MVEPLIDITQSVCPMTFVRVKLAMERMAPGEQLRIRLTQGEPLENVPRSLQEEGHIIVNQEPDGLFFILTVQKTTTTVK